MKTRKITTVAEAQALPEIRNSMYDFTRTTDPKTGLTTEQRIVRPLSPRPVDGDQILFFMGKDGRMMEVVYTEDGPAICEARL